MIQHYKIRKNQLGSFTQRKKQNDWQQRKNGTSKKKQDEDGDGWWHYQNHNRVCAMRLSKNYPKMVQSSLHLVVVVFQSLKMNTVCIKELKLLLKKITVRASWL